jgi:hypothetical protein
MGIPELGEVGGGRQLAPIHGRLDGLGGDVLDVGPAVHETADLGFVEIDAERRMACLRERQAKWQPHVSQADHGYVWLVGGGNAGDWHAAFLIYAG